MRTTLDISDDVLAAARAHARRKKTSLGEAISELARAGLTGAREPNPPIEGAESEDFFGFRPLPRRPGVVVTNELIDELREEED